MPPNIPTNSAESLELGDAHPVKVGTITNYAEQGSKRFGAFQNIYRQLSGFAHPMSKSIFASTTPSEAGFRWRLDPAFKYDDDFLVACAWVVELAETNAHLLVEYADSQGWGSAAVGDHQAH